jgi:hypothetical protein
MKRLALNFCGMCLGWFLQRGGHQGAEEWERKAVLKCHHLGTDFAALVLGQGDPLLFRLTSFSGSAGSAMTQGLVET